MTQLSPTVIRPLPMKTYRLRDPLLHALVALTITWSFLCLHIVYEVS